LLQLAEKMGKNGAAPSTVDLTLNRVPLKDVPQICALLKDYPNLEVRLVDNEPSWSDVREVCQWQGMLK
jgi:hypothetical protein